MSLDLPSTAAELDRRAKVDVGRELETSNPFLRNSWLGALVTAFANRVFDFYYALNQALKEALPDTAVDNLERWGAIFGILRYSATSASGNIVANGTGGVIPIDTGLVSSDGLEYVTTAVGTIAVVVHAVDSITLLGEVATLTTIGDHGLASNVKIIVVGASQSAYNVTFASITVTGTKTLTYEVLGSPTSPATGTITMYTSAVTVPVRSLDFGSDQNQPFDAGLIFQSPIAGVDSIANVDIDAIGGGEDQESISALKARILDRIQNPVALFNVAAITAKAKSIEGVTRVFIQEITPEVGQVTIYFVRDGDPSLIPDGSEVAAVKAAIDSIKPAMSDTTDVVVAAPTPLSVDFTFTDLQPATITMQQAVEANLNQFFDERTDVGVNIDEDAYRAAIYNTVDTQTGDVVTTFTLSVPPGDIVVGTGELGVLGDVVFP